MKIIEKIIRENIYNIELCKIKKYKKQNAWPVKICKYLFLYTLHTKLSSVLSTIQKGYSEARVSKLGFVLSSEQ